MRILYVQDTDWIRRNPIQHNHLAERMVLRGHEVRVIDYEILWRSEGKKELVSKRQTFRVSRLFPDAVHTVIRPSIIKVPILDYVSMLFTYTREINRQIREFAPNVIIADCILTPFLAFKVARGSGIPSVYYILDVSHKLIPFKILHSFGRLIERANFRNADLILSINQTLKDYSLRMGAHPDKSLVFRAGFDSSRFHEGVDGCEIRKRYGIARDEILLLFVGWLHHFNGIKEVALELAKRQDNRIKLLVVGDGDAFEGLESIREKFALHERFILTGRKPYDEVPSFIAAADICLLPAYPDEPIIQNVVPMKMSDYMAMGKPVIATRLPGIIKEFGEGNGIVYVERPEDTVEKALELVEGGIIAKFGARARSYVESYDWDDAAAQFENVLKGVTKEQNAVSKE